MNLNPRVILDLLTLALLSGGLLFIAAGTLGLVRMPDVYHRIHAMTKGVTLGMAGLLLAAMVQLLAQGGGDGRSLSIVVSLALVILFQFIANPVGAHLLAKAAHRDGVAKWRGTLGDELEEDAGKGD